MTCGAAARMLSMIGLCVVVMAPPVSSQTEAVELRFRLKPEEVLRYTIVLSSLAQTTIYDLGGATRTHLDRWSTTVLEEIRASAEDEDGATSLEITQQETKTTGASRPIPLPPINAKVRPNGQVVGKVRGLGTGYFPIGLPDHAVLPGESWTYKQDGVSWDTGGEYFGFGFVTADMIFTSILVGVDGVGGSRVARVQTKGDGAVTICCDARVIGASKAHVTGEATWSIDGGRLLRFKKETSFEVPLEVKFEGRTYKGKGKFTVVEEREPSPGSN